MASHRRRALASICYAGRCGFRKGDKLCCEYQYRIFSSISNNKPSTRASASSSFPSYTIAVARRVPQTFSNAITKFATMGETKNYEPIDLNNTIQQHERYLEQLRKFVPTICLPAIYNLADSVFVEDTVVAIGKKAVITNPGHPSRRAEVDSMRQFLSQQLGMSVIDMQEEEQGGNPAYCDGGDVLYTSRHLFVGISERTNMEAVKILQHGLDVEAIPIPFEGNALHLKSIVTHVDDNTLLVPQGTLGDKVIHTMGADDRGYTVIRLPNILACNVVSVNGELLAQDVGCSDSKATLEAVAQERNMGIEFMSFSEFAKADGALTCCSILLNI